MKVPRGLLALGAILTLMPATAHAQRTIVVVRHAEKAATPAGDPPLSPEGRARAEALRDMLKDARVKAIVTSPFRRTKETAQPLATALGLTPTEDPMTDPKKLAKALRALPGTGNVLVVGHTNTIPGLIKALGADGAPTIAEDEFDNVFVVTLDGASRAHVLRLHFRR